MRRRLRAAWRWLLVLLAVYVTAVVAGMNPTTPPDLWMNLGSLPVRESLAVEGSRPQVVILQRGLWRSAHSLWKLQRSLQAHGYVVINPDYPSTAGYMADHADRLANKLELRRWLAAGTSADLHFIGFSMGGLVVREYLSRAGSPRPRTCLFMGSPNQGACLVNARKDWLLFQWLFGDKAPLQLQPGSEFLRGLRDRWEGTVVGVLYGCAADLEGVNRDIPGNDDGTVGVLEALLPGADTTLGLRMGHTRLSFDDRAIEAVLYFLKYRRFR